MAKLIILRGNSGSGKSTVATALQKRYGRNTMCISQDVVRRDVLYVKDGEGSLCIPLLCELLKYGHDHSEVTILEGILDNIYYGEVFETANTLFGNKIYAYYFDLSFEETVRRHNTRAKRAEFTEEDMQRWWIGRDIADLLEEKIITAEESEEEIIERIMHDTGDLP